MTRLWGAIRVAVASALALAAVAVFLAGLAMLAVVALPCVWLALVAACIVPDATKKRVKEAVEGL